MADVAAGAMQGGGQGLKDYGDLQMKKKIAEEQMEKDKAFQKEMLGIKHQYDLELEKNRKVSGGQTLDLSDLINAQRVVSSLEGTSDTAFELPDLTEDADFTDGGDDDKGEAAACTPGARPNTQPRTHRKPLSLFPTVLLFVRGDSSLLRY